MIKKIFSLLPFSYILLGIWVFIPVSSNGVINEKPVSRQPSELLVSKVESFSMNKIKCGKNSLCKIYGADSQLNRENSLKLIAFVNTMSAKR